MIEIPQSPCKRGKFYKTEESTTAIQSAGKHQKGQPVRTKIKNTRNVQSAGKREWTRRDLFKFWIWLVEKVARFFLDQLHSDVKQNRRSSELLETLWKKNCSSWQITDAIRSAIQFISSPITFLFTFFHRVLSRNGISSLDKKFLRPFDGIISL